MFTDATDPALVTALSDPATYGTNQPVEALQTHVSHVFLAGERAYKLKKAVGFPFCDFSTLAARQRAAALEITLNRRTAPALYLGLAAIKPRDGGWHLGPLISEPEATALPDAELVVVMRRFDRRRQLDHLYADAPMGPAMAAALADQVAALHQGAERLPRAGWATALRGIVTDLVSHLRAVSPAMPEDKITAYAQATLARLDALAEISEARGNDGFVRRCHGDLHLGNIYAEGEAEPVLFDAIEFNDSFAEIDVLYDLAFLLMDLIHRGMIEAANRVMNRWLEQTQDYAALGLLAPMIATRAAIRAMVGGLGTAEDPAGRAAAVAYLDTAAAVLAQATPRVIAIGGLSGTGKSTLARVLAPGIGPAPGAVILRSDKIRKTLHGVGDQQRLPQTAYSEEQTERTYRQMSHWAGEVARNGLAVILDARHATDAQIAHATQAAEAAGTTLEGLWLQAPLDTLRQRVNARTGDTSDADLAVLEASLEQPQIDPVKSYGWQAIDTSEASADEISGPLAAARRALGLG